MKKNLTLSIDEALLDKARILAAIRKTSVNDMIRKFLAEEIGEESRESHKAEWESFFQRVDREATETQRAMPGGLPGRGDMYDEAMRERGLL